MANTSFSAVRTVTPTANQIVIAGTAEDPIFAIATDPIIPGTGSITVPTGTTGQRVLHQGALRNNTTTGFFECSLDGIAWVDLAVGGGGIATVTGTANQIGVTAGPNPVISIANNPILPGTGGVTLPTGTTGQRAGAAGTIRYNSTTGLVEFTNTGATWLTIPGATLPTTDEAIARFDGVNGQLQNSIVTITDAGIVSGATQLNVDNVRLDGNSLIATNANGDLNLEPNGTGVVNIVGTATASSELRWFELTGGGVNYIGFKAPNALAGNTTYILPVAFPAANGYTLKSTTAGVMSWAPDLGAAWIDQTATPVTIVANSAYSANTGGLLTFNMPAAAAFGDVFEIAGNGAGGWLLQMNAGQTANLGSLPTSVAGSLASTNRYDCVKLLCTVANTTFTVISSMGNITAA